MECYPSTARRDQLTDCLIKYSKAKFQKEGLLTINVMIPKSAMADQHARIEGVSTLSTQNFQHTKKTQARSEAVGHLDLTNGRQKDQRHHQREEDYLPIAYEDMNSLRRILQFQNADKGDARNAPKSITKNIMCERGVKPIAREATSGRRKIQEKITGKDFA